MDWWAWGSPETAQSPVKGCSGCAGDFEAMRSIRGAWKGASTLGCQPYPRPREGWGRARVPVVGCGHPAYMVLDGREYMARVLV